MDIAELLILLSELNRIEVIQKVQKVKGVSFIEASNVIELFFPTNS